MNNSPVKTIILFFIGLILFGTILLCLPFSRANSDLSVLTCLFTSTSAVCVTGLVVVDIGTYFSTFGQCVILLLIQLGGFGYMLVSTGLGLILGKMALKDRKIMQELFDISSFNDLLKLLKKAIIVVLGLEFIGSVILAITFLKYFPLGKSVYLGIFHSISAFCNAGISPFANSLENFAYDPYILYTIAALIVFGGLGFFVLVDIIDKFRRKSQLTFHTKIILWMTLILTAFGFIFFCLSEAANLLYDKPLSYAINNSLFQIISARTAGFNSMPAGSVTTFSAFLMLILMFIGGGPGSTAGGLKITNLAVVFAFLRSMIKGTDQYLLAGKSIDTDLIKKALTVFVIIVCLVLTSVLLLTFFEPDIAPVKVIFEAVAAVCTAGLSIGITADLSNISRVIIIFAMFIGRVGAITILIYLISNKSSQNIKYPDGKLLIG